ncbi:MAG TPA: hypothetical protein VMQ44_02315 [Candidatus Saccharimonadales bacterium]|nr:hypothetical protein [Candidatus Saccharimonadales bacterium]
MVKARDLMQRFAKSYLTIVLAIVVLANLALIIMYGRQFIFQGATVCDSTGALCNAGANQGVLGTQLLIVNGILLGMFGIIWFVIRHLRNLGN